MENETPKSVDDDHFTWWFDELMSHETSGNMSTYEIAQMAWVEAIKRLQNG